MDKDLFAVAMRYTDSLTFVNLTIPTDTITEHNKIIEKQGKVYLGKFGRALGRSNFSNFNDKNKHRVLILIKKENMNYVFFEAIVKGAFQMTPEDKYIPTYYRDKKNISVWFEISDKIVKLDEREKREWIIVNSGNLLLDILPKSTSSIFIIYKKALM